MKENKRNVEAGDEGLERRSQRIEFAEVPIDLLLGKQAENRLNYHHISIA